MTRSTIAMRRRACGCGPALRSRPPTSRRCCHGSTGPMARSRPPWPRPAEMAHPKVLISDELSPRAVEIFRARGLDVDEKPGLKPGELKAIIGGYDGLAVRSATKVTGEIIAAAERLKVIGRAGIRVCNLDVPAATAPRISVIHTP